MLMIQAGPASEQLVQHISQILIAQGVLGALALVGLVAIIRRFINTEFPATMKGVHDRLDTLHEDLEELRREQQQSARKVERHDEKLDTLRERIASLETRVNGMDRSRSSS